MNTRGYLLAAAIAGCALTITACSSTPAASSAPACQAWGQSTSSGQGTAYALTQIANSADGPVKPFMQTAVAALAAAPDDVREAAFSAVRDQCAAAGVTLPTELHTTLHLVPVATTH